MLDMQQELWRNEEVILNRCLGSSLLRNQDNVTWLTLRYTYGK